MRIVPTAFSVTLLCLVPHVSMAQEPGMPPGPSGPPAAGTGACTIHGPVLEPADYGMRAGAVLADTSAVRLDDGRVRLYTFAEGLGVVTAAAGFGTTITAATSGATVVRLADGRPTCWRGRWRRACVSVPERRS